MNILTHQNCVSNAERSPHSPVRYLLGYRDRQYNIIMSLYYEFINVVLTGDFSAVTWMLQNALLLLDELWTSIHKCHVIQADSLK